MKRIILWTVLLVAAALSAAQAEDSLLTEKEAPLLRENNFSDLIKKGNCIVMYYEPDGTSGTVMGMTPLQLGDYWMRGMMKFREQMGSVVKFYRVNWKDFSPAAMERIKSDLGSGASRPASPMFAVYAAYNAKPSRVRAPVRPDLYALFLHDIMDDFMPISRKPNGDYLYAGWMVTDTTLPFINLMSERKDSFEFNGKSVTVQIIKYASHPYENISCEYERIYSWEGKLLGSIENCGKYGKFGYFDYDGTGKFQYRVKYDGQAEKEKKQQ